MLGPVEPGLCHTAAVFDVQHWILGLSRCLWGEGGWCPGKLGDEWVFDGWVGWSLSWCCCLCCQGRRGKETGKQVVLLHMLALGTAKLMHSHGGPMGSRGFVLVVGFGLLLSWQWPICIVVCIIGLLVVIVA